MAKYVYFFGGRKAEGNGKMKDLLGGKGAGLAEMTNSGATVPPGFTITTEACDYFYRHQQSLPSGLKQEMEKNIRKLEKIMNREFDDSANPLLVSVRSGAKFSMPGMMDTILNLGLNDKTIKGLIKKNNNERFAWDAYRRLIQMFGNVVMGIEKNKFERLLDKKKEERKVKFDSELSEEDLKNLVEEFRKVYRKETGEDFPQDSLRQLTMARDAVFKSWSNPRAITYRKLNKIPDNLGTAVNVQVMVFGNMGNDCGTGVGFTRNPSTGEKKFYGEYLLNAQGEDVVAGVRTPSPIENLKKEMPEVYQELKDITTKLEKHYQDTQDFEFTVENGKLFMLQTRTGKRTAFAAVKIAVDMVKEGLISKEEALMRLAPAQIDQLLHPILDPKVKVDVIARGLPASPGAASGTITFTAEEAVEKSKKGPVILVRQETCPDDIHGMDAAKGILTARGGMTSHAAVVARGMGKPCVTGCEVLQISEEDKEIIVDGKTIKEGAWLTIDGGTGRVISGKVPTVKPSLSGDFGVLMKWADKIRKLGVRANADIPRDAKTAINFGAEGIGLCRTEHMFFAPERLPIVRRMILADTEKERQKSLDELLPLQREDFLGLFKEMKGYPVIIRTIDPPLHEFLPRREELMVEIALMKERKEPEAKIEKKEELLARVNQLHEMNPMLGHRGCRLGITYPEITEMQVRAIMEAACELAKKGKTVLPEIMIPLVGHINEFKNQKAIAVKVAKSVMKNYGVKIKYLVGTMIEIPRGAITADEIATEAEFFSFGTNDLTQMGFGFSRDDAGKFIQDYLSKGILKSDPFQTIDQDGIGKLIEMGIKQGRKTRKNLEIGICGEHGGDPESVKFCHQIGMDYVSCSPFRVPIARLAAAQAVLEEKI
ncbi:MAG: pyruvate, phosphate dikinase [bacterium (Candidatus Ratteibacteria) CG_4_9_14_3_um_filter_41_21]|uniref:Pyruvate, phosphate dikinase n=2 Tax=Candidatus Ratteibacteria TaxID=2979319 RepID=A0A2M7E7E5_9BACT|nr:MAG: pyruvate, phosphate dikinase [Candidatus Omnitrophica bacterium CG1_02_41_171]PIV63662.1 MAG: pyruvate, phosphate dikinase [bacterium (Candidatus Ratteibacteria) CG01_land_8_20_14_3_00_40_19]PIW74417.1 MAG: pyruvate, phosphate dikinase [bacterium (Candidatus Ratteibacteria) CG_4_8_14_3_um_filter_41_36]PJA61912.1 MAG: pyruvate, phosphate dikinase [bacterium (Candidatus Ratteibacteria) CG_4_9_14_3_um_filter_41_21]HCG76384.1 pyruvate, phosphate dikinase [bacterium]